ncbi:hypothetical protein NHF48_017815 [Sphingomonas sp. H160509]|uniref:hypothetical protein n=1 Tax=Sphingomonas sp. H160509 TaxID=2955313 RepID=UPI002097F0F9|nr:hypothetical protein [Sphingomonas sp. H160509]MDD1452358.1 hypothetical protein [Sphingomonas sp. H160509]
MDVRSPSPSRIAARAIDRQPPAVFGLGEDSREQVAELLDRKLAQVAETWPIAIATQMVGCALLVALALIAPPAAGLGTIVPSIGVHAAILVALSAGVFGVLRLPGLREWPAYKRNRALTVGVAGGRSAVPVTTVDGRARAVGVAATRLLRRGAGDDRGDRGQRPCSPRRDPRPRRRGRRDARDMCGGSVCRC